MNQRKERALFVVLVPGLLVAENTSGVEEQSEDVRTGEELARLRVLARAPGGRMKSGEIEEVDGKLIYVRHRSARQIGH